MKWSNLIKGGCAAAALSSFAVPQANAIEIFGGSNPAAQMSDGMISKVYVRRGGAVYHGGTYRGPHGGVYHGGTVYRGGAYRGGVYRGGVYRGGAYGYHGYGYRPGAWGAWARPGGYWWPAGGAIAAGAAIGMVSAASAAAWAGSAPGPGLCWYYTDPSRQQGFWDACH